MRREFVRKNSLWNIESIIKFLIFILIFLIFTKSFVWGSKGFLFYRQIQNDIKIDEINMTELKKEISHLKVDIEQWKNNDFMIEKIARQELQMALPDEKVYLLNKQ